MWNWGRSGGHPRFAVSLAQGFRDMPDTRVTLSLSRRAEILLGADAPVCELPVDTYRGMAGFIGRVLAAPFAIMALALRLRAIRPDLAVCAGPGPLDLIMVAALRIVGCRLAVVVHDADAHPGDGLPLLMTLQRLLCRSADGLVTLSAHVASRLREQGLGRRGLIEARHPAIEFGVPEPVPHDGPVRLLFFGRLLPYKGIGLLAEALRAAVGLSVRVVGCGPESADLDKLRRLPAVTVENRWVAEAEIGPLLTWADALVLPYTEASQSGVAAAALAAGRIVIATRVGGLEEQLAGQAGVSMCAPTPDGVAAALRALRDGRIPRGQAVNARAEWRDMAARIADALP